MIFCRENEEESIFQSKNMYDFTYLSRFTTVLHNFRLSKILNYRHKSLPCQNSVLNCTRLLRDVTCMILNSFRD